MAEIVTPAKLVGCRYLCDECGDEMARDGDVAFATSPLRYPHRCPNGHTATLNRSYPGYDVLIEPAVVVPVTLNQFLLARFAEDDAAGSRVGVVRRSLRRPLLWFMPASLKRRMAAHRAAHPDYRDEWRPA